MRVSASSPIKIYFPCPRITSTSSFFKFWLLFSVHIPLRNIFLDVNSSLELLRDNLVREATTASIRLEAAIIRISSSSGLIASISSVHIVHLMCVCLIESRLSYIISYVRKAVYISIRRFNYNVTD